MVFCVSCFLFVRLRLLSKCVCVFIFIELGLFASVILSKFVAVCFLEAVKFIHSVAPAGYPSPAFTKMRVGINPTELIILYTIFITSNHAI